MLIVRTTRAVDRLGARGFCTRFCSNSDGVGSELQSGDLLGSGFVRIVTELGQNY